MQCEDKPGIVAFVSQFLYSNHCNIVHMDQFSSEQKGFFLRVEYKLEGAQVLRAPAHACVRQ